MRNRNIILSIILIFGIIVMAAVTFILIKFPNNKDYFETENRERVVIVDESPSVKRQELNYKISHYSDNDGKIDIEYPCIIGFNDINSENNVNNRLKVNATSILALHELKDNIDSLDINATIKSFDDEKIIVVYEGELLYHTGNASKKEKNDVKNVNEDIYDNYNSGSNSGSSRSQSNGNFGYDPNYDNYGGQVNTYNNFNGTNDPNYDNYTGSNFNNTNNNIPQSPTSNNGSGSPTFFNGNSNAPISNNAINSNMYPGANNAISGFAGTKFYEKKIYYTNTLDLTNCKDIGLNQLVDINTLAQLIKGNDKDVIEVYSSNEQEARKYLTKLSLDNIKSNLSNSDFRNTDLKSWPKCFSYSFDNSVYIYFPTTAELNDYLIITYNY